MRQKVARLTIQVNLLDVEILIIDSFGNNFELPAILQIERYLIKLGVPI